MQAQAQVPVQGNAPVQAQVQVQAQHNVPGNPHVKAASGKFVGIFGVDEDGNITPFKFNGTVQVTVAGNFVTVIEPEKKLMDAAETVAGLVVGKVRLAHHGKVPTDVMVARTDDHKSINVWLTIDGVVRVFVVGLPAGWDAYSPELVMMVHYRLQSPQIFNGKITDAELLFMDIMKRNPTAVKLDDTIEVRSTSSGITFTEKLDYAHDGKPVLKDDLRRLIKEAGWTCGADDYYTAA